jgi:hypothetical protein
MKERLGAIWAILYEASSHPLGEERMRELDRLLRLLEDGIPGNVAFNDALDGFVLAVRTAGPLDRSNLQMLAPLLIRADELRRQLDQSERPEKEGEPG